MLRNGLKPRCDPLLSSLRRLSLPRAVKDSLNTPAKPEELTFRWDVEFSDWVLLGQVNHYGFTTRLIIQRNGRF